MKTVMAEPIAGRTPTCWRRTPSGKWYKTYVAETALPGLFAAGKCKPLTEKIPKAEQVGAVPTKAAPGGPKEA